MQYSAWLELGSIAGKYTLRQLEYINALYLLNDADEDEVDDALTNFHSTARSSFSYRTSTRFPSGVPSLLSDRSSQRGSVVSLPLDDGMSGLGVYGRDISHVPMQYTGIPNDTGPISDVCSQNDAMDYLPSPGSGYDQPYHDGNVQILNTVESAQFHQGSYMPTMMQTPVGMLLPAPGKVEERNISGVDSLNQSPFIQEQDRGLRRPEKPRFPCPEPECKKHFAVTAGLSKHLTGIELALLTLFSILNVSR
jgi:hypothetical protein